jgi:hypothetical protein
MTPEQWSLVASFVAMLLIASSYFWKNKSGFLLMQAMGMVFLMVSYCLDGLYFPMIGLTVGLARSLIFYAYEKHDKVAPLFYPFLFTGLSVIAYLVINVGILHVQAWYDSIYLVGLVLYAFIFRIRNIEALRYIVTIPTALSILYNVVSGAAIFAVISYCFELGANLVSILKYHVFGKNKEDEEYEKN